MAKAWVTYTAFTEAGTPDWSLAAGVQCEAEHPDALDQCETRARKLHAEAMAELRQAEDAGTE